MTTSPNAAAQAWLADFDRALQAGDIDGALELFDEECYWRDFVSFTWNLKTLEGKEQIRRMLDERLADLRLGSAKLTASTDLG